MKQSQMDGGANEKAEGLGSDLGGKIIQRDLPHTVFLQSMVKSDHIRCTVSRSRIDE